MLSAFSFIYFFMVIKNPTTMGLSQWSIRVMRIINGLKGMSLNQSGHLWFNMLWAFFSNAIWWGRCFSCEISQIVRKGAWTPSNIYIKHQTPLGFLHKFLWLICSLPEWASLYLCCFEVICQSSLFVLHMIENDCLTSFGPAYLSMKFSLIQ